MKSTTLFTALALAAVAPLAFADNCTQNLHYCGYTLLSKGNYFNQIVAALAASGEPTDPAHVNQTLFHCGKNGEITLQVVCPVNCKNGGAGNSDFC